MRFMEQAQIISDDPTWQENVEQWVTNAGIFDEQVEHTVASAFGAVPRRLFLDEETAELANRDIDLPVGYEQWINRPSLQIRMVGLLNLRRKMRVLELGFGSGYLCGVMSFAGAHVFGVEQIGPLAQSSRKRLDALGYHGVVVRRGEGRKGWPESAPFDGILVSYPIQGQEELPLSQLAVGGLLVAPMVTEEGLRLSVWKRGGRRIVFEEVDFR